MNHLIFNDKEMNPVSIFEYYCHLVYFCVYLMLLLIQYKFKSIKQNCISFMNLLILGGPLFVKIGQNIANKSNIDQTLKTTLLDLQNKNFNSYIIKPKYISDNYLIDNIESEPIASGSIASIYKIKYQNKDCIIKVLHQNVRNNTIKSINLFEHLKSWLNGMDFFNYFNHIVKLEQIYQELLNQTDLRIEANNLIEIKNNFSDKEFSDLVIFPEILYYDKDIIIESFLDGYEIYDFIKLYPDRKEEASHLINCVFYKMFFDNCIHADMHFSNVKFKVENDKVKIVLLDFGLVSRITNIEDYKTFINVYKKNIFCPDVKKFKDMMVKFNFNPNANIDKFKKDLDQYVDDNKISQSLNDMTIGMKQSSSYKNTTDIIKGGLDLATKNNLIFNDYAFNICNGFILLDDYNVEIADNNSLMRSRYEYANKNGFVRDMTSSAESIFKRKKVEVTNVEYNDEIESAEKIKI